MQLKITSAKWRPFCFGLNVSITSFELHLHAQWLPYDAACCRPCCEGSCCPVGATPGVSPDPVPIDFVIWDLGCPQHSCSWKHTCSIKLQSGESGGWCRESGGWCSIVTPFCSMKSRTIRHDGQGPINKIVCGNLACPWKQVFSQDVQVHRPSAIQEHEMRPSISMKGP